MLPDSRVTNSYLENTLKTLTFLAITLISGVIARLILAFLNLGLVEPYMDSAIALETQKKGILKREREYGRID